MRTDAERQEQRAELERRRRERAAAELKRQEEALAAAEERQRQKKAEREEARRLKDELVQRMIQSQVEAKLQEHRAEQEEQRLQMLEEQQQLADRQQELEARLAEQEEETRRLREELAAQQSAAQAETSAGAGAVAAAVLLAGLAATTLAAGAVAIAASSQASAEVPRREVVIAELQQGQTPHWVEGALIHGWPCRVEDVCDGEWPREMDGQFETCRFARTKSFPLMLRFRDGFGVEHEIAILNEETRFDIVVPAGNVIEWYGDECDRTQLNSEEMSLALITFHYEKGSFFNSHGIRIHVRPFTMPSSGWVDIREGDNRSA